MTSSPLEPPPDDAEDDDGIPEKVKVSHSALDVLAQRLAAMEETMRREHERAAHREKVIDRLHAENQELRHGLLEEALNPVRAGLYRLYDTARRQAARWREEPPSAEHAASLLEAVADEVGEVLGRAGAERVPVNPGDVYDPVIHRPVRTAAVEPEADGTVVEVLADGFAGVVRGAGGAVRERVARKADVVVGRVARKPGTAAEAAVRTPGTPACRDNRPRDPAADAPAESGRGPAADATSAAETTTAGTTTAGTGTVTGTVTGSGTETGTGTSAGTGTETGSRTTTSGSGTATGTGATTSGTGTTTTGTGTASVRTGRGREEGDG